MRGLILLYCVLLCGCARRPVRPSVNYFVGGECHPKAKLFGCDLTSPPHCRRIALDYDKACEQIVAGNTAR